MSLATVGLKILWVNHPGTAEDHRRFMEWAAHIGPHGCQRRSRLVARAWVDPDFKLRLLADGTGTCKGIRIDWLDPTGT